MQQQITKCYFFANLPWKWPVLNLLKGHVLILPEKKNMENRFQTKIHAVSQSSAMPYCSTQHPPISILLTDHACSTSFLLKHHISIPCSAVQPESVLQPPPHHPVLSVLQFMLTGFWERGLQTCNRCLMELRACMKAEPASSFCRHQDKPRRRLLLAGVAAPPTASTWQEMDTDKAGEFVRSRAEAAAEPVKGLLLKPQGGPTMVQAGAHPETLSPS